MRPLLLFTFCFSTLFSYARKSDSTSYRCRLQLSYQYSMPLGDFSYKGSNNYLMGQFRPSSGVLFSTSVHFSRHFAVGFQFSDPSYKFDGKKILTQLEQKYLDPAFFTTIEKYDIKYEIPSPALEFSYSSYFHSIELEPFVTAGICRGRMTGAGSAAYIHRKKKNDNYYEDIYVDVGRSNTFFYPGFGIRLNKKIVSILYATLAVQYNTGTMKYSINEERKDIDDNVTTTSADGTQQVSSLQIEGVLQLRFTKMRNVLR